MNCLEIEIWHSFLLLLLFSDTQTFPFSLACTLYKKNKLPIPPRSPKVRIGPGKKYEGGGLSTHLRFPGKSIYLTLPGSPGQSALRTSPLQKEGKAKLSYFLRSGVFERGWEIVVVVLLLLYRYVFNSFLGETNALFSFLVFLSRN